jgi:predicted O-methyltransferase YrrM
VLSKTERASMTRLWTRKLEQDSDRLPRTARHRNLHPDSAELIHALAVGLHAQAILEIGGSSGISTIALASAARATGGRLTSIEIEPTRQAESRETISSLGLSDHVRFILGDAADALPGLDAMSFVFIDCEKEDYVRFFDMVTFAPGAVVVADNILSHDLSDYVAHVRSLVGGESLTLPVGKGLEITRIP